MYSLVPNCSSEGGGIKFANVGKKNLQGHLVIMRG